MCGPAAGVGDAEARRVTAEASWAFCRGLSWCGQCRDIICLLCIICLQQHAGNAQQAPSRHRTSWNLAFCVLRTRFLPEESILAATRRRIGFACTHRAQPLSSSSDLYERNEEGSAAHACCSRRGGSAPQHADGSSAATVGASRAQRHLRRTARPLGLQELIPPANGQQRGPRHRCQQAARGSRPGRSRAPSRRAAGRLGLQPHQEHAPAPARVASMSAASGSATEQDGGSGSDSMEDVVVDAGSSLYPTDSYLQLLQHTSSLHSSGYGPYAFLPCLRALHTMTVALTRGRCAAACKVASARAWGGATQGQQRRERHVHGAPAAACAACVQGRQQGSRGAPAPAQRAQRAVPECCSHVYAAGVPQPSGSRRAHAALPARRCNLAAASVACAALAPRTRLTLPSPRAPPAQQGAAG